VTDWVSFEGRVEAVEWGRATYTILRLPPAVADSLTVSGTRRVMGELNDHPVNLALTKAPIVDGVFLWAGRSLLDKAGIEPGELVEVRLRPASDANVDVPDDVVRALREAGATAEWIGLTPGKQRGLLYHIGTAKTLPTRLKRIAALVAQLSGAGA
jgi:Bacteriocin-protection, YdeI or OmpD-Associated/Domain of unknown function (DUF1905)